MGWQQGVKDVQIKPPTMKAVNLIETEVPVEEIDAESQQEIADFNEQINQKFHRMDTVNLKIGVCHACNRYPKTLFKDVGICVGGTCFKRFFKGLLRSLGHAI